MLLRLQTSYVAKILVVKNVNKKSLASQQVKLGLVLEEKLSAHSIPKSDNRVEFGLCFPDELLRTCLKMVWELMKTSWCPSPIGDSILRATQDVRK